MGSLTDNTPKPMLMVGAKNLIEHKLDMLPPEVDEVIIIVGYLGHVIQQHFGGEYRGRRLLYIDQANIVGGTADALWQAKDILQDRCLVMMGDDLYAAEDIAACLAAPEWALLVQEMHGTRSAGAVRTDESGEIRDIEEGEHAGSWYASTNLFVLDARLFGFAPIPKAPGSHELGLPQTVIFAARALGASFRAIPATRWIQITAPEDLAAAEFSLRTTGA